MDILQKIGPAGANGELQTDRNTLQIWGDKAQAPCPLLSQVCCLLDHRFARRYVCVVFVAEAYYEETLARWHDAFSSRMRTTLCPPASCWRQDHSGSPLLEQSI